jgi:capsular polysaccharide biosynthesis protein
MIGDISVKFAEMNIQTNVAPSAIGKLVSQTPSKRLVHKQQTTVPALGGLFLGLIVALGAALLVDRSDRTIRDPATAAAAFAAPFLSLIPVNGD